MNVETLKRANELADQMAEDMHQIERWEKIEHPSYDYIPQAVWVVYRRAVIEALQKRYDEAKRELGRL